MLRSFCISHSMFSHLSHWPLWKVHLKLQRWKNTTYDLWPTKTEEVSLHYYGGEIPCFFYGYFYDPCLPHELLLFFTALQTYAVCTPTPHRQNSQCSCSLQAQDHSDKGIMFFFKSSPCWSCYGKVGFECMYLNIFCLDVHFIHEMNDWKLPVDANLNLYQNFKDLLTI